MDPEDDKNGRRGWAGPVELVPVGEPIGERREEDVGSRTRVRRRWEMVWRKRLNIEQGYGVNGRMISGADGTCREHEGSR